MNGVSRHFRHWIKSIDDPAERLAASATLQQFQKSVRRRREMSLPNLVRLFQRHATTTPTNTDALRNAFLGWQAS